MPARQVTAKFYYPANITGATETNLKLFFYNGSGWQAIKSSGGTDPIKDTTDNLDGTVSGGAIMVVFDNTSSPQLMQMTGTVIAFSTVATPTAVKFESATVTAAAIRSVLPVPSDAICWSSRQIRYSSRSL